MESLRVLVVDDEPGMRLGVERALRGVELAWPDLEERWALVVDQAASGEEGLERIAQSPPDILLLDQKLPGMSGLDVLAALGERAAHMLTVMITAYATIETAILATKRGAYDFLPKPFTPEDLRNTVRKTARHLLLQREARRLAEEKRQVRFQFLSVLAHELKAPLGAVEGYLNIMKDQTLGPDLNAYGQPIERSLLRLDGARKLIFDLLDLTRIESGQKRRDVARVDLAEVATLALETVQPAAEARGIAMLREGPAHLMMAGDRGELEIVLNNLLSNAVKYNRDGGRVTLRLTEEGERARIEVSDTGIGMSPQDVARLFGEFVRIKNEHTRSILGSGLGLSIVKRLSSMYGGEVSVTSEPGVGSTFTVLLGRESVPLPAEERP